MAATLAGPAAAWPVLLQRPQLAADSAVLSLAGEQLPLAHCTALLAALS